MAKDRTLDHPSFDGAGFEKDSDLPRGLLRFRWGESESVALEINLETRKASLTGNIEDATKAFWSVMYKFSRMLNAPVINVLHCGVIVLQVDVRTGALWHDFEDETAKFLFNEFEIRAQGEY